MNFKLRLSVGRVRMVNDDEVDGMSIDDWRELWINPRCKRARRLVTLIHEWLHAEFFDWSEARVCRVSREAGERLWAQGWRYSSRGDAKLAGRAADMVVRRRRLFPAKRKPAIASTLGRLLTKAGYRLSPACAKRFLRQHLT